jgi:hypothetical protein
MGDAHPVVDVDGVRKMIEFPNMVSTQPVPALI